MLITYRGRILALTCALGLFLPGAFAQTTPIVQGNTSEGKPFELSAFRGKVVFLMFWSTKCAVCRDKMPEIRANHDGWKNQPFEVVLVNTDKRVKDFDDYEKVMSRLVPISSQLTSLWQGDAFYKDNLDSHSQLPASYVIDKSGKVVQKYVGRVPAEAWDKISELF
ncbi:MAG: TlpA family protein disulfide reductase [Burkholderiaceae bacterium]